MGEAPGVTVRARREGIGHWAAVCAALVGCATGNVREANVGALGAYPAARGIAVEPGAAAAGTLDASVAQGARRKLDAASLGATSGDAAGHLTLRYTIQTADQPNGAPREAPERTLSVLRSFAGLAGVGQSGARAGRLVLAGQLLGPDGRELGALRWEREGTPQELAEQAGEETAIAVARLVEIHRADYVARRAADERLVLTPTPLTLAPGELVVSDDELLIVRLGVGLSRRLQLDLLTGGVPIPGAAGGALAGPAIVAGGAAGGVILGFMDVGLKLRVLDETARAPGLSVSYDMLDLFGLGAGGAGLLIARDGAGGVGYGVVAGANAQFNLVTLVAGKHFGPFQLTLGTWLLDNHHYLPQTAAFQGGCAAVGASPSGAAAGAIDCGSGSAQLPRLPLQVQPFAGGELVLGEHSALMMEALLEQHVQNTLVTTGARWLLGARHPRGPLALDRVRVRLDLAALWFYVPAQQGMHPHGAKVLPLPWLGLGVYVL
jgi:hypothetical protein